MTFDAVYYNSVDPSLFIDATGEHALRRWDVAGGYLHMSVPGVRVKLPKGPVLFLHTGHWIFDTTTWELIFQKGHSDLFEGDLAALCHALEPL